jgi:hypothetical protein
MTTYNVHLYREMRLTFEGIEADTPEAAAAIARDKPTGDADDIYDCEGESLSALVDVAGDEEYAQSGFIDFEAERQRKAARKLLTAPKAAREFLEANDDGEDDAVSRIALAAAAIAEAEAAEIIPAAGIDIHAILAEPRQIAEIWSVEDVQAVRPGLTAEQGWEVLQTVRRRFDAAIGINWDVLKCFADEFSSPLPESSEAKGGDDEHR